MPKEPSLSLNKRSVDAVKPMPGRTIKLAFDKPRGLALIVYPSGRKSFALRYGEGTQRKMMILGDYGALTVEDAEKMADERKGEVAKGRDPAADKKASKATPTFESWVKDYLQGAEGRLAEKWIYETRRYLKAVPFGGKKVTEVTTDDVQRFYNTMRTKGAPTANRALAAVRATLSAAYDANIISGNPARGQKIRKARENQPRQRFLTDEELHRLFKALGEWPDSIVAMAFRLAIMTGLRRSEILRGKWADLDFIEGVWHLPKTKAGRVQSIPLTDEVKTVLEGVKRKSEYIIPGLKGAQRKTLHAAWADICEKAGIAGVTPHDLRRSYGRRVLQATGNIVLVSKLLRHSDIRITERIYTPFTQKDLREAAETTATERRRALLKVVNGGKGE